MQIKAKSGSILQKITGLVMLPLFILTLSLCIYFIYSIYGLSKYSNRESLDMAAKGAIYALKATESSITPEFTADDIGKLNGYLKELKNSTSNDYNLYLGEQKIVTTNPSQILKYTKAENLENGDVFFNNVPYDGKNCCVYIKPFELSSNSCKIEVVNTDNNSFSAFTKNIKRIFIVIAIAFIPILYFVFSFLRKLGKNIMEIRNYSNALAIEEFDIVFSDDILSRGDELQSIATDMTGMKDRLQAVIEKDLLTKIYNRRAGEKRLEKYRKDYKQNGTPFSFAIGDIDFFKKVNDTYGHEAGDEVLKMIAKIIDKNMKKYGFAARWGGEEFMLVFQGKSDTEAATLLEKILDEIRAAQTNYQGQTIKVTMTFGVVEYKGEELEKTFRKADHKLYIGKERGRNRVVLRIRDKVRKGD